MRKMTKIKIMLTKHLKCGMIYIVWYKYAGITEAEKQIFPYSMESGEGFAKRNLSSFCIDWR